MSIKYIKPTKKYLQSYYEACKESWNKVHNNYILHNPDEFEIWKDNIFKEYENQEKGINLPKGYVPSVTYWIVNNDTYIGTINIRLFLNSDLRNYGGHIGIAIRVSKRNSIYGIRAVEWALKQAKKLKISPILATCQKSNILSLRLLTSKFSKYYKKEEDIVNLDGISQPIIRFWYK